MKKVAIYLRVSTSSQTVENQRRELEAYAKRQDWKIIKVYEDDGISGSRSDRPALNEMLKDSRSNKFEILACWSVDRLGRSTVDLLNILTELQDCGIGFVATSQGLTTENTGGRMLVSFLSIISQFEKEILISRVNAGISRARADGKILGRPRTAFDIGKALELRKQGKGYKSISKILNVPKSTLFYCLESIRKTQEEKVA